MKQQITLTGNELKQLIENRAEKIVQQIIETKEKKMLNENIVNSLADRIMSKMQKLSEGIAYDDYGEISNALAECGWAYSDAYEVHRGDEQGIRYIIEPYPNNLNGVKPMDVEQMKQRMTELLGEENVVFSEGQHRYAPEIKNLSMVVIDNGEDDDEYYGESVNKRKPIKESWELDQMNYYMDKQNGKYNGKNPCGGQYNIGDVVSFKMKGNEIQGVVDDVDFNYMTHGIAYDVNYDDNGTQKTMMGVPEERITLIKPFEK